VRRPARGPDQHHQHRKRETHTHPCAARNRSALVRYPQCFLRSFTAPARSARRRRSTGPTSSLRRAHRCWGPARSALSVVRPPLAVNGRFEGPLNPVTPATLGKTHDRRSKCRALGRVTRNHQQSVAIAPKLRWPETSGRVSGLRGSNPRPFRLVETIPRRRARFRPLVVSIAAPAGAGRGRSMAAGVGHGAGQRGDREGIDARR
jgi:hypothetical protein